MTLYVSEHARAGFSGVGNTSLPITSFSLTSASTFQFPQVGSNFVRLTADSGCYVAFSTSTAAALTSTNALRIPPNAPPEFLSIPSTTVRLVTAST